MSRLPGHAYPRIGLQAGHRIELLQNGETYFPALEGAIRNARNHVWLETYIFARDVIGMGMRDALSDAAGRGVEVRVLVDGFGSGALDAAWWQPLTDAGGEVRVYHPEPSLWSMKRRHLRRLHRKLAVVDGQIALVSGINIEDDWNIPGQAAPRFDFAVRVEGPLVLRIIAAMEKLWLQQNWRSAIARLLPAGEVTASGQSRQGNLRAALLLRDNLRHRRDIEHAYLLAIGHARRDILIANAYFLPGRRFRQALMEAARRGVRVTLLLQGMVEYRLQHAATRALYGPLLDAGVDIHEYRPSHLHAKVAVIDGRWATVGSSNIDPFSLLLAREANVVIEDEAFARELKQRLDQAIQHDAQQIAAGDWHRQSWHVRLRCWLAYGVVRWGLGLTGIGKKW
jgi:cardiolipin synthase A/B